VRFRRYESHLELLEGQDVVDTIRLEYGRGRRIIRDEHYPGHERARLRITAANPLQAQVRRTCAGGFSVPARLKPESGGTLRDQMERIITLAEAYSPCCCQPGHAKSTGI